MLTRNADQNVARALADSNGDANENDRISGVANFNSVVEDNRSFVNKLVDIEDLVC